MLVLLFGISFSYCIKNAFANFLAQRILKGIILPLFKGKGAKANNKDSYCGITLFPTLCKIYEMVLLNRLEKFAADGGYFSEFGFREGVGCIEASFTILETINYMLERGSKVFSCFLEVRKAFDTVWIDGLLYKLFNDLGIKGRMWLAIKDLYTDVKAQVLYSGELSREFDVSQAQVKVEFLRRSCTKFTSIAFYKSYLTIDMQFQLIHFHWQPLLLQMMSLYLHSSLLS